MPGFNCPHCKEPVQSVNLTEVHGVVKGVNRWKCVAFACQTCGAVLSVQIDPVAIKTDMVNDVANRLGA